MASFIACKTECCWRWMLNERRCQFHSRLLSYYQWSTQIWTCCCIEKVNRKMTLYGLLKETQRLGRQICFLQLNDCQLPSFSEGTSLPFMPQLFLNETFILRTFITHIHMAAFTLCLIDWCGKWLYTSSGLPSSKQLHLSKIFIIFLKL